uniref:Uncharacterized protein n=1 Tax=Aegilops tauschii subsp. strangulata TaxID=200361 RepID=A0A453RJX2_AEGTS
MEYIIIVSTYLDKSIATLQMELAARRSKHELLESADGKAGKEKGSCGDRDQYRLQQQEAP